MLNCLMFEIQKIYFFDVNSLNLEFHFWREKRLIYHFLVIFLVFIIVNMLVKKELKSWLVSLLVPIRKF